MSLLVSSGGGGPITASDITDSSASGRTVLTGTAAEGRSALGIASDVGGSEPAGFYIDTVNGNDTNSGRTPAAAIKTLSKLQSLIVDGARVFVKCGTHVYGTLASSADRIKMLPYGVGPMPIMDGSKDPATVTWSVHSGTTYKTTVAMPSVYDNIQCVDTTATGTNPFMLRVVASAAAVVAQPGSCYYDGTTMYVQKWDGSAITQPGEVLVSISQTPFQIGNNAYVSGIEFWNGIGTTLYLGLNSAAENCSFRYCGKHHLITGGGDVNDCQFRHVMNIADLPSGYSAIAFYFSDASNPSQNVRMRRNYIEYGLAADGTTYTSDPAGNALVMHNAGAGTGYYTEGDIEQNTIINHYGLIYGNAILRMSLVGNTFIDCAAAAELANCRNIHCFGNRHIRTGKSSFVSWRTYTLSHQGSAANPCNMYISGDEIEGGGPNYSQAEIFIPSTAAYINLFIRNSRARLDGTRGTAFLLAQDGVSNIAVDVSGTSVSLRDTGMIAVRIPTTGVTYSAKRNTFSRGSTFQIGSTTYDLCGWRSAKSVDLDSCYIVDAIGYQNVTGSTGDIAVGQHYQLLNIPFPGLANTDELTVCWGGGFGNPNTWATITYAVPGPSGDAFHLYIRNLSTSVQNISYSCRVTATRR